MEGGAWWATVHRVAKSWTRLSDFTFTFFSQADCSVLRCLIAKFRLKLKKVGKTTRPFRYALSQIPYDYTVEVRNRFKGLDLMDRMPDELWMEVPVFVQEIGVKTIPKKKKCKKKKKEKDMQKSKMAV